MILQGRGLVAVDALITDYSRPELAGTGYRAATVQQALDICVAVDYDEEEVCSTMYVGDGPGTGAKPGTRYEASDIFKHTMAWGSDPPTETARAQGAVTRDSNSRYQPRCFV